MIQTMSLKGLSVLNTRPEGQNQLLSQAILAAGGHPLSCPLIEIVPLKKTWLRLLPDLQTVQQAIFISSNAVAHSFSIFKEEKLIWPSHIIVTAIGAATAKNLQAHQVGNINVPPLSESEGLLGLPSLQVIHNQTILLFKGEGGLSIIADGLKERGCHLIACDVYKRKIPEAATLNLNSWLMTDSIDIILYTSEESLRNIFALASSDKVKEKIRQTSALVISKRLTVLAREFGIRNVYLCKPDAILSGLEHYNQGRIHGNK